MNILLGITASLFFTRYALQVCWDLIRRRREALTTVYKGASTNLTACLWAFCIIIPIFVRFFRPNQFSPQLSGIICIGSGSLIGLIAIIQLGQNYSRNLCLFKNHTLVTWGIYSIVRHPIRLGSMLEVIGFACFLPNALFFIPALVLILILKNRSMHEDEMLRAHFGLLAIQYQNEVPAFNMAASLFAICQVSE